MSTAPVQVTPAVASDLADRTFVGRRREMAALRASLDVAAAGTGRLDIVSGPAGIGKTRLTHEIGAVARERGFYVLRGGCWEGEGAPAYWPWADVLRNHLGAAAGVPGSPADFSHLLEMAASQADVPVRAIIDASKDAQQARFMLFDRFCELLAVMARNQPLLVIVDDVQFADTGSLLLLQFLASRLSNVPLALLVTSREPLSELTASTARHPWARHRVLPGLSRSEARTLLAAYMPGTPRRSALDRLMHLTEGNPFFVKELGHLLTDGRRSSPPGEPTAWPVSLLAVTLQPYQRLSPACRALLQAASVVGREFDADVTAQAARVPTPDALLLLDEAVQHRVVAPIGPGRYHFVHALVREAIESQLHPSQRTGLHDSVALALETLLNEGDEVAAATLAHHFTRALPLGPRRQAALHCMTAGQRAYSSFAFEEAVYQLRRAHEVAGTSLTDVERCDLLLNLGAAEAAAGEWARSRRIFEDAAASARRINCPIRLARAALGFKGMMWATAPVDTDAVDLLEEARATIPDDHVALRVELLSVLSRSLYFSVHNHRSKNYSDAALALALATHDIRLRAIALESHTVTLLQPGRALDLLSAAATMIDLADGTGDFHLRFNARIFRQFGLLTIGRLSEADEELEALSQFASSHPHPRFKWQLALLRAARATLGGHLTLADRLSATARRLGTRLHDASPIQYELLQGFHRAQLRDDSAQWLTAAQSSLANLPDLPAVRIARAGILARNSQVELAAELLHGLADNSFQAIPPSFLSLFFLTILAEVASLTRDRRNAEVLYDLLEPHKQEFIVAGWGTAIDGSVAHYLALLASCLGRDSAAREHFTAATAANRRIGAPVLAARSTLCLAQHLADFGDASDLPTAYSLATHAAGTYTSLDLPRCASRARDLANRLHTQLSKSTPPSPLDAPTEQTPNVFRREADYWTLTYQGTTSRFRATLGFAYLATLLSQPGTPIHALDLIGARRSEADRYCTEDVAADATSWSAYRQRLAELSTQLDEAETHNNLGLRDRLSTEREMLLREMSHSFSRSGLPRPYRSNVERARISARNRVSAALKSIAAVDARCALFLKRSLKTGTFCLYDPVEPTEWHF